MSGPDRAEQALRDSERRFRALIDHAADAIIVHDHDGRVLDVNRRACESLGYSRAELLRMHVSDIEIRYKAERMAEVWERVRGGDAVTVQGVHRRRDGGTFPVEVRVGLIETGGEQHLLAIARDVTERKRAEQALRESEQRFRLMVEGSNQVFFYQHDPDHRFTYLSPSVEAVLGYSPAELIGQPFEVLHPGDPSDATVQEMTELALRTGRGGAYTAINRHKDGRIIPVEIVETPVIRDGVTVGLQGFARDISDRIAAERALRESEAQLRHSHKLEAVGRLAGGVAHDFNNLLTAIGGHAEFLLEELPPDNALREDAEEIHRSAERAAALTRQLLAFGRKQMLRPTVLDLNDVVLGMTRMLERVIGEDVALLTELDPALEPVVADRGQMEQVVMNLALNARDAMPDGGELVIRTANAGARAPGRTHSSGRFVRLSVIDTGHGMDDDVLAHIFEPYYTTKEQGKGTGLGLATVYGIIKQSRGEIAVESVPGEGTAIRIQLPATQRTAPALRPLRAPTARPTRGGETILVVEDEPAVRQLVRRTLERRGYHVLEAGHGGEALRIAAERGGAIDLIITDVVMPGIGGRELAERLAGVFPPNRILYTSGYTEDEIFRRGVPSMADRFLAKPFSPTTLAHKVRHLLDQPAEREPTGAD